MWGHEHRCIVYDKEINILSNDEKKYTIKNAMCVGHGAMPTTEGDYKNANDSYAFSTEHIPGMPCPI